MEAPGHLPCLWRPLGICPACGGPWASALLVEAPGHLPCLWRPLGICPACGGPWASALLVEAPGHLPCLWRPLGICPARTCLNLAPSFSGARYKFATDCFTM